MTKSLYELRGVIADRVIAAAIAAHDALRERGIPHALAGGLAVAAHGYERATADVDFLVDDRAFDKHGDIVSLRCAIFEIGGVRIDFVSLPEPQLDAICSLGIDNAMEQNPEEPLVAVEVLVVMKLRAGRMRDLSDVAELIKRGGLEPDFVETFIELLDLELLRKWRAVRQQAEGEAE